jgi:hypothetical protein
VIIVLGKYNFVHRLNLLGLGNLIMSCLQICMQKESSSFLVPFLFKKKDEHNRSEDY